VPLKFEGDGLESRYTTTSGFFIELRFREDFDADYFQRLHFIAFLIILLPRG